MYETVSAGRKRRRRGSARAEATTCFHNFHAIADSIKPVPQSCLGQLEHLRAAEPGSIRASTIKSNIRLERICIFKFVRQPQFRRGEHVRIKSNTNRLAFDFAPCVICPRNNVLQQVWNFRERFPVAVCGCVVAAFGFGDAFSIWCLWCL